MRPRLSWLADAVEAIRKPSVGWIVGLVLLAVPVRAPAAPEIHIAPETFTLDNGLQVVVLPDHRAPVATSMVWYKVGSADEPWGKSGLAHFLEHLMFKGTKKIPPAAFSLIVARNGGQDNAFTSYDYTAYFERVAVDRLPLIFELEADRMANLVLTDPVVAPELKVVLEERHMRTENDPTAMFGDALSATQYLTHPYAIPVIGWRKEIESLKTEDAVEFYRRHYGPDNAILIVAGDVTADSLKPLVEKTFGPVPSKHIPPRFRPTMPPQIAARDLVMRDARVNQPLWERTYLAPSYQTVGPNDSSPEALDLLAEILGGGQTSRLYRVLVVEKQIAAGVDADYSGVSVDDARFAVSVTPRPGGDPKAAGEAAAAVLDDLLAKGITPEELALAKNRLLAAELYRQDSQESMAFHFGAALATGQTIDQVVNWPKRIQAVTLEQVEKTARQVLAPERSVTGLLLPAPSS